MTPEQVYATLVKHLRRSNTLEPENFKSAAIFATPPKHLPDSKYCIMICTPNDGFIVATNGALKNLLLPGYPEPLGTWQTDETNIKRSVCYRSIDRMNKNIKEYLTEHADIVYK